MDSNGSNSGTLSIHSAASPTSTVMPPSLKRKITPSAKGKTTSDNVSSKKTKKATASDSDILQTSKPPAPVATAPYALTPPTTPMRQQTRHGAVAPASVTESKPLTSSEALVQDVVKNPLSIYRFKGIPSVLAAINRGPLKLRFPGTPTPEIFVLTGLLQSHDMTVIKEVVAVALPSLLSSSF
jgi:hypothetical protein